ncbi:MAG: M15 family metallopeptidase [Agathobacter sp.]|nr:M15 family metallopeptidase [Agathobacter sp.]
MQSPSTNTISQGTSDLPWYLTLVNSENPIDDNYQITLTRLRNKQAIDSRCYPELQAMMDDCRAAGLSPIICSSYRTYDKQEELFEQQVQEFINQGYGKLDAQKKAAGAVARPGTSEHELGLAIDIVDESNQRLNQYQENTAVQRWLMQNSWRYGFILRYPSDKTDITGIQYEPWHYRFVGKEAARIIYENNWTLEEYLNQM